MGLVEHEARHHEIAADHTGAREREQLTVHQHRRVDQQPVARVVGLRAHQRACRHAELLEHRDALMREHAGAEPAQAPRGEPGARRREAQRHQERHRQHQQQRERPTGDRAEGARDELGRRRRLDATLDHPERPVEEPAEEAPRHVAEETAQDPADALGLEAEAVGDPEPQGGAQQHDEQPNSLDEQRFPFVANGPAGTETVPAPRLSSARNLRTGADPADGKVTIVTRRAPTLLG